MGKEPPLSFILNGRPRTVEDVPDDERLLDLLRWRIGLKGTKEGCRSGDCGACSVLLQGRSSLSCLTLAREVQGSTVETVEGLVHGDAARRVSEAFARSGAVQCGYCTPGFVVAVASLLRERADERVTSEDLARELGGNLCRCTGYYGILRALTEVLQTDGGKAEDGLPTSTFEIVSTPRTSPLPPAEVAAPRPRRSR